MERKDCAIMSEAFGAVPYKIDASGLSLAQRPRLYWCDWELLPMEGVTISQVESPCAGEITMMSSWKQRLKPKITWNPGGISRTRRRGSQHSPRPGL